MLRVYCVSPRDGINVERYWLMAGSEQEARHLLAVSVAVEAENAGLFDCITDGTKNPPPGFIHCEHHAPVEIRR
jgi:hypothetical protein